MRKLILQLSCVLLLTVALVSAQTVVGTLTGKITGTDGKAIPNAAVTVTNATTNASVKVLTGPDGGYSVAGLPPGTYRVDVEAQGFTRTSRPDIKLVAGPPQSLTINLVAGNGYQSVELRGTAPAIQTDGGTVSIALSTRTVRELPVVDRNQQELVGLQTGVTPPIVLFDVVRDPQRNRYFSVNGQNPFTNEWMLDGVWNTEPFRDSAIRVIPEEATEQLQISTATLPARNGFTSNGFFQSVTRPGTNDWHGNLFEFYSGNILGTRNFFNTAGNPDQRLVYNQMGGAFGGPVAKDKLFIFGSYEGTFANGSSSQLSTVPTTAMLNGNFSAVPGLVLFNPNTGNIAGGNRTAFTNNIISPTLFNPAAAAIASFLPAPNLPGFTNNLVSNTPYNDHGNKADGRVDYHMSDNTGLFLRYGFSNFWSDQFSPFGNVIGAGSRGRLIAQNAIGDFSHSFSPSLVTDFRFGYNRYDQHLNPLSNQTALGAALGSNLFNNLVGINIEGFGALGTSASIPEHGVDNTFNWVWSWTYIKSNHNVKAGVDIRRVRTDGFTEGPWNQFGSNGTAFFGPGATMSATGPGISQFGAPINSFAAFLLGAPSQIGVENFLTTPTIRQTQYGLWIGDTIQLSSRLTADLGVRYEIYRPLEPRNAGGAAFFDPTTNTFNFAGVGGNSMHLYRTDVDAVAPRIGVSFRATSKTVLRGGYSIHYYQPAYAFSGYMPPIFGSSSGVQGGFTTASPGLFTATLINSAANATTSANGVAAGNLPATVIPRNLETPYVQSFNFQVQQEFYYGTVLTAAYVGSLGRHTPFFEELNSSFPGTGVAGLPLLPTGRVASTLLFDNSLTNNYNSLQVSLNKRFAQGVSFMASYTWSKALGYTSGNGFLANPFDLPANYGPLDYDRQSVLSIAHLWELPFGRHGNNMKQTLLGGWQLNGIFTWDSGVPLTITANPIGCACPNSAVLASFTGANPVLDDAGTQILNPAAFTAPALGQFGNVGRGAVRAPGYKSYNMSLFKRFKIRDRFNTELRGEAYNLTNTPHFLSPVTNINSPNFGQQVGTVNNSFGSLGRQINLALRVTF
jgi:Carboxypeptidase regulatory-like domain/TonB dependent receptor